MSAFIFSLVKIAIGYFLALKVPGILGVKKGAFALCIKILGVLLMILGFVSCFRALLG